MSRRAFAAACLATASSAALGRIPYGGRLRLRVPWPLGSLDPHVLDDVVAALWGPAIADSLYALDSRSAPYPTLAQALPAPTRLGAKVTLRPGLVSARGRVLSAADVVFSWTRARQRGAAALLAEWEKPTVARGDPLTVEVRGASPEALAVALASPLTALVPRSFSPAAPDGTGAFVAQMGADSIVLQRNPRAARGAAFLDSIEVRRVGGLAEALRAFETGEADLGWLGSGLHRPRPDAVRLEGPRLGWVVLRTGPEARAWGAPGVAQRLLDAVAPSRLAHLGLELPESPQGSPAWGGPAADLVVDERAPQLVEIAKSLAAVMQGVGHEVRPLALARVEFEQRRTTGRYALMLDFVRPLSARPEDVPFALLTAADPALVRHPPRLGAQPARIVGRSLSLGVLGELRLRGASSPGYHGLNAWDLGAVWQESKD
jgi:peptide/nickel transport system substrate-binding protein